MNKNELIKIRDQIKEEYKALKEDFFEFCNSEVCSYEGFSSHREHLEYYLEGEMKYDRMDAEVQNDFWFLNGKARRKFDNFRNKGGVYYNLYYTISKMIGDDYEFLNMHDIERHDIEDECDEVGWDLWWLESCIDKFIHDSEEIIAEEKSFLEVLNKGQKFYDELDLNELNNLLP